jgi:hypothetical protein
LCSTDKKHVTRNVNRHPRCAADVPNGTACRERCESEVATINEVHERNKTGYQKASGAYARTSLVYLMMGVIMTGVGALTLPTGLVILALGVAMLVAAAFSYSTARKMARPGP